MLLFQSRAGTQGRARGYPARAPGVRALRVRDSDILEHRRGTKGGLAPRVESRERLMNRTSEVQIPGRHYNLSCASCVRDLTCSLRNTLCRWYSTVFALMNSLAAISRFVSPRAARRATRVSCEVSSCRVSTVRLPARSPVASSSRRARSANASTPKSVKSWWVGGSQLLASVPAPAAAGPWFAESLRDDRRASATELAEARRPSKRSGGVRCRNAGGAVRTDRRRRGAAAVRPNQQLALARIGRAPASPSAGMRPPRRRALKATQEKSRGRAIPEVGMRECSCRGR